MNFVILHGTPYHTEKTSISDGGIYVILGNKENGEAWNYKKSFKRNATDALIDGNYFDERDGGICKNGTWTDERRQLVHDKWLALIDIIDRQLEEKGRFDIEFINYFTEDNDKSYKKILKEKINKFLADVENDKADASVIVDIMEDLEEKY